MRRSASRSTPRTTAGASATSRSASHRRSGPVQNRSIQPALDWEDGRGGSRRNSRSRSAIKGIATGRTPARGGARRRHGLCVEPRRAPARPWPRRGGGAAGGGRCCRRAAPGDRRRRICRGTDVVKAIAAGADLVGLGPDAMLRRSPPAAKRAWCDCSNCWRTRYSARWGCSAWQALRPQPFLSASPPATQLPHVLSAFNLLKVEEYRY